jgi:hypothetical protein
MNSIERSLSSMLARQGDRIRAVTNILLETPYFYREDNEELFFFLRRSKHEFARFFNEYFGWTLVVDSKCARVFKERWYNDAITPSNRDLFNFTRRDECLGFMLLLEFFEHQLEEHSIAVEDKENLRFRFADLLTHAQSRLLELFPEDAVKYSEDTVRGRILRAILPTLEKYRFLRRIPPPQDETIESDEMIFEALPALYHYNAHRLSRSIIGRGEAASTSTNGAVEPVDAQESE